MPVQLNGKSLVGGSLNGKALKYIYVGDKQVWSATPPKSISFVNYRTTSGSNLTLDAPDGTLPGDRVFGVLTGTTNPPIGGYDAPSGWTTLYKAGAWTVAYRDMTTWTSASWGYLGNTRGFRVWHFTLRRSDPSYAWATPTISLFASDNTDNTSFSTTISGFTVHEGGFLTSVSRLLDNVTFSSSSLVVNGQSGFDTGFYASIPKGSGDDKAGASSILWKNNPAPGSGNITYSTTLSSASTGNTVAFEQTLE
ncbi:hypothetical protein SEA_FRANKIE_25 [Mycobacterium phage Frankie]|nr:hypothetical protein SEA_FRANKIE_25 [Mycobacterium phage Frankie]